MENESCRNIDTHYPALISMTKSQRGYAVQMFGWVICIVQKLPIFRCVEKITATREVKLNLVNGNASFQISTHIYTR